MDDDAFQEISLQAASRLTRIGPQILKRYWHEIPTAWVTMGLQYRVTKGGLNEWQHDRTAMHPEMRMPRYPRW